VSIAHVGSFIFELERHLLLPSKSPDNDNLGDPIIVILSFGQDFIELLALFSFAVVRRVIRRPSVELITGGQVEN
jgi:hypothetical protein